MIDRDYVDHVRAFLAKPDGKSELQLDAGRKLLRQGELVVKIDSISSYPAGVTDGPLENNHVARRLLGRRNQYLRCLAVRGGGGDRRGAGEHCPKQPR